VFVHFLRIDFSCEPCKHGNEPLGTTKNWEHLCAAERLLAYQEGSSFMRLVKPRSQHDNKSNASYFVNWKLKLFTIAFKEL